MFSNRPSGGAHRQALAALAMLLTLGTAACGKDSATGPSENFFGAYALALVEGETPPVTVFEGPARLPDGQVLTMKLEVLDSEASLDEDGSYFLALVLRMTANGKTLTQSLSNEGTFERSGSSVEFLSDDPEISDFTGTFSGGRLKLDLDLMGNGDEYEFTYSKGR